MDGIGYFLFFLVGFLGLTILLIWPVFPSVIVAILLAYLVRPINDRLAKLLRPAGARAALLTVAVLLLFAFPLVYAIQLITTDLGTLAQPERFDKFITSINAWLIRHQQQFVADSAMRLAEQLRDWLLALIPFLFGSVFNITLGVIVCLFLFFYFAMEGAAIWNAFLNVLPLHSRLKSELSREITGIIRAIVYGQLLVALVQGGIGGLGLVIFRIPQPLVLTILMVLASFVPLLGTTLVWVPAAVLHIAGGHKGQGIGLLIYGILMVITTDSFLRTRLIAMHSRVHPAVVFIGIIGGAKVFGFIGFLVGPVIFATFLQLLQFFAEYLPPDAAIPP